MIKKLLQNPWLYTIFIGVLFILPFMIIAYYTYPSADDLCRVRLLDGYWFNIYNWYTKLNGRFLNALIVFLPVYNFSFYWLLAILFMWILGASAHYMLKQALAPLGWSKSSILLVSTAFLVLIMVKLPTPAQFFYWYAASSAYVLGLALNMIVIGGVLKMNATQVPNWKSIRVPALAAFCAIGCHEMSMAHAVGFLLAAMFLSLFFAEKRKVLLPKLLVINIIGWIATALCILAPGNVYRLDESNSTRDVAYSLNLAWENSLQYIIDYFLLQPLIILPAIVLFLAILINLSKSSTSAKHTAINPLLGLVYMYAVVFVLIFLVGYSVVIFLPEWGRIANMIWVFTVIVFMLNTINFAYWIHNKISTYSQNFEKVAKVTIATATFVMVFLGIQTKNYKVVWNDLLSGRAAQYVQEFEERLSYLDQRFSEETPPKLILTKPFSNPPETTFFMDITGNWDTWENYCFCSTFHHFYGKGAHFMLALGPRDMPDPKDYIKLPPTPDAPPLVFELHPNLLSGTSSNSHVSSKGKFNPLLDKLDNIWSKVSKLAVDDQGIAVHYDSEQHILIYKIDTSIEGWETQQFFLELSTKEDSQDYGFILNGEKTLGGKRSGNYFYYVRALPERTIQMIKTGQKAATDSEAAKLWQKEFILIK